MKYALILLFVLITVISCQRDKEIYLSNNINAAFEVALNQDKNIFIDFYTTWCGGCRGYDKYIFPDSIYNSYLRSNFVSLKLDAELPENIDVVKRYNIDGCKPSA